MDVCVCVCVHWRVSVCYCYCKAPPASTLCGKWALYKFPLLLLLLFRTVKNTSLKSGVGRNSLAGLAYCHNFSLPNFCLNSVLHTPHLTHSHTISALIQWFMHTTPSPSLSISALIQCFIHPTSAPHPRYPP